MTFNEYIRDFIVDAQYRVGVLTTKIDERKRSNIEYDDLYNLRIQLSLWIDLLYESFEKIKDGYNFLDWTEFEIKNECEYLRAITGITRIPYISFATFADIITNVAVASTTGDNIPAGSFTQILAYDASGIPVAQDMPDTGGMGDDSIEQYFT